MPTTLIVPGLHSSGPDHWQTWFETQIPAAVRVIQRDWSRPELPEWSRQVRRVLSATPGRHFVVAHSFGVLASIQAAADMPDRIAGALLVAPADPDRFNVADHLPQAALPFPAVIVASSDDTWMSLKAAAHWADTWEADLINLGAAGHINPESGFGPWPEGLAILERLRRTAARRWIAPAAQSSFDIVSTAAAYRANVQRQFSPVRDAGLVVPRRRLAASGAG